MNGSRSTINRNTAKRLLDDGWNPEMSQSRVVKEFGSFYATLEPGADRKIYWSVFTASSDRFEAGGHNTDIEVAARLASQYMETVWVAG